MNNIILLILVVSFITYNSCTTDEEQLFNFKAIIKNESNEDITIEAYSLDNLVFENELDQNQTSDSCEYISSSFFGYICPLDSMVFRFNNQKGYISLVPIPPSNVSPYEFPNKSPFGVTGGYTNKGNNTYEFIITEEDYNNAFDID